MTTGAPVPQNGPFKPYRQGDQRMAKEVTGLGNGLVIDELLGGLRCELHRAGIQRTLRAAAARVGEEFRRTQGVTSCIDAVAGAFASPGER